MKNTENYITTVDGQDFLNLLDVLEFDGVKMTDKVTEECEAGDKEGGFLVTADDMYSLQLIVIDGQLKIDIIGLGRTLDLTIEHYNTLLNLLLSIEQAPSIDGWLINNKVFSMMELGTIKFFNVNPEFSSLFHPKEELLARYNNDLKGNY